MATEYKYEELLETLGLDKTKKDMVILGALLKALKEPTEFIDFETLRDQLAIEEGSRKGKDPLIYRSLSRLEKEGFLKIDKSGHKHGYTSNAAMLEKATARLMTKNLKSLERQLKEIDSEVAAFSEMNPETLASGIIDFSLGKERIEKSVFAQGWDNIIKLLDNKVYGNIKKGDVVRIKLEWLAHIDYLKPMRVLNMENLLDKGMEIRALDHDRIEREIRKNMRELLVRMKSKDAKVVYRIHPREDATYQFVAKNTEGIVLIVSESPLSATWLPRSGNVELVDNAIESFDRDFEVGIDLLKYEGENDDN